MEMVPSPGMADSETDGCAAGLDVYFRLGEKIVRIRRLVSLRPDAFQKARRIQFTLKQIGEIALHETFRFILDFRAGMGARGLRVVRALEVTQIFECFH